MGCAEVALMRWPASPPRQTSMETQTAAPVSLGSQTARTDGWLIAHAVVGAGAGTAQ